MIKKTIFSFFLFFVFVIVFLNNISATSDCFPDETNYLCVNSYWSGGYLYCNIDDVVFCSNGCVLTYSGEDYCAGEGSVIPENPSDYSFAYIYYPNNPLSIDIGNDQYNEPSSIYEGGMIHRWTGRYSAASGKRYFQYSNSSNGLTFSNPVNLTGFNGASGQGYGLGYVQKVGDLYYMFAINTSKSESFTEIDVFSSSNKINWTLNCTNITTGAYKKNSAFIYNNGSSLWEALIEEGSGNFDTYYWSSSNLCSGWTKHNRIEYTNSDFDNVTRGSAPQIFFDGDTYIVYLNTYQMSSYYSEISVFRGTTLDDLIMIGSDVINRSVGLIGNYFVSDVDVVVTPGMARNFYAYFIAVNTNGSVSYALAYDNANRTFENVHHISTVVSTGSVYNASAAANAICPPGNPSCQTQVISGTTAYNLMTVINRIFPEAETLSTKQKFVYILLTLLLIDILLLFLIFKAGGAKVAGALIVMIDLIFFFFFIGMGYIPVGFLIVGILLLIALIFLKIKGGG